MLGATAFRLSFVRSNNGPFAAQSLIERLFFAKGTARNYCEPNTPMIRVSRPNGDDQLVDVFILFNKTVTGTPLVRTISPFAKDIVITARLPRIVSVAVTSTVQYAIPWMSAVAEAMADKTARRARGKRGRWAPRAGDAPTSAMADRQMHMHPGPVSGFACSERGQRALHANFPVVLVDNGAADPEPKPRVEGAVFGGEERIERMFPDLCRHAWPVVRHGNADGGMRSAVIRNR